MFLNFIVMLRVMRITLTSVAGQVRGCQRCPLYKKAHKGVPGEGNPKAKIMLIGQAPGREEDKTGRPFVGRAGKFLTAQLKKIGIARKDVFITSVVKHFPPKNRLPTKDEVNACLPYCIEQIYLINPKTIVLLGSIAEKALKGHPALLGRKVLSTPHPAAAMRFPKLKKKFEAKIARLRS